MHISPIKINTLPLLVIAFCASVNAAEVYNKAGNKLDLYGKVDALHQISDNSGVDGDATYVRFGFKGETLIDPEWSGYGQWEYQANANQAESSNTPGVTRLGFAGLSSKKYGSIDYGRNFGVIYDIAAWTDTLPEFGGDAYGIDNFMFKRTNNLLTWHNNNLMDGVKLVLQYQGKNGGPTENTNGRDALHQNGDGYGASLIKEWDNGISIGASFASSKRTQDQNNLVYGNGDRATVYRTGLRYDANRIYLAATYTQSYNATIFGNSSKAAYGFANRAQIMELTAKYAFDNGLMPVISYIQSSGKDIENFGNQDLLKYLALGSGYYFNKNMSTAVMYKVNMLDDNNFTRSSGLNTDDVIAIDLIYNF